MKLLTLKFLNFRRFAQEEIFLGEDLTLIYGKNGSGKTSIFDGIGFALFGPKGNDFIRINRDHLRSSFLSGREPSKVELQFQYGMDTYKIVRVIDAGTKAFASKFIVESKDTLTSSIGLEIFGGDEITQYVESLVGVTKDTFLRSVFTKQKDIDVLSGNLSERKSLIHSILGLDKIEYLIDDIRGKERIVKTEIKVYEKRLGEYYEEDIKEQKSETKKATDTTKIELIDAQKISQEYEKTIATIKQSFTMWQDKKQHFSDLSKQIDLTQTRLNHATSTLKETQDKLTSIKKYEQELQTHQKDLEEYEKTKNLLKGLEALKNVDLRQKEITTRLETLTKEIEILEQWIKDNDKDTLLKKQKDLIEQKNKLLTQEKDDITDIATLQTQIDQLTKEGKELKNELDQFLSLGKDADCPTCKRPLESHFPHMIELYTKQIDQKRETYKALDKKKKKLELGIEKLQNEIKNSDLELESLQENLTLNTTNIKLIASYMTSQKELTDERDTLPKGNYDATQHKALEKQLDYLQNIYDTYHTLKGKVAQKDTLLAKQKTLEQDIKTLKKEHEMHQKILEKLGYDEKLYQTSYNEYQTSNSHYQGLLKIASQKESEYLKAQKAYDEVLRQENEHKKDQSYLKDLQKNQFKYLQLQEILREYIHYLLSYLKPILERISSEYFTLLTDGKYATLTLDSDYSISIDHKPLDLYSGGERDLANLCFRLSLGQNLSTKGGNPINFLILDEVLGSQDIGRQKNIMHHLAALKSKYSQILLISHHDDIKDFAHNLIEIKQKSIEESEVIYH